MYRIDYQQFKDHAKRDAHQNCLHLFSGMMLCNMSLVIMAVLVAGSGLPVGCPPYILAYPGITPVGRCGATGAI